MKSVNEKARKEINVTQNVPKKVAKLKILKNKQSGISLKEINSKTGKH